MRRNRELAMLNSIAGALNRSLDVEEGLVQTLALVGELLGLRAGWVWLLDEAGDPHLAAAQALPPYLADPEHPERMLGMCHCLRTFKRGALRGAANVNIVECSRLWSAYHASEREAGAAQGLRYHASIPLTAGTKMLGVLNVASPDGRRLRPDELQFLSTIGNQVGLAVERARLSSDAVSGAARLAIAEERNRLAREIHDTLAQHLAGITLYLETAEQALPSEAARAREGVAHALDRARLAMQEARRSVADLRAAPLRRHTLPQALADLANRTAREAGAELSYTHDAGCATLPAHIEVGLYRIAQEALTNIARHAQARHIWLTLACEPATVDLTIRDDGRGFDPDRLSPQEGEMAPGDGHFGFIGMAERARLMGTNLCIESAPGMGTTIRVQVVL
jgi:two-component system, NarL family, sensor kinase